MNNACKRKCASAHIVNVQHQGNACMLHFIFYMQGPQLIQLTVY